VTSLLTAREVASRLRLGKNGPYALAQAREVETVRIGARLLFTADSVEALVKRNTTPAKRVYFGKV
jgi:excisionase family DNA binding protein